MSKHGSLVYQVKCCFRTLEAFGQSRHQLKQEARARGRVATNGLPYVEECSTWLTERRYRNAAIGLALFAGETFGIRLLPQLTSDMVLAYLRFKWGDPASWEDRADAGEVSASSIATFHSAMTKFEIGISRYFGLEQPPALWPDGVKVPPRRLKNRVPYRAAAYTEDELEVLLPLIAKRSPKAAVAVEMQVQFGLRVNEACCLQKRDVDLDSEVVHVKKGAKGGRRRDVPIPAGYTERLGEILDCLGPKDRLAPVAPATIQANARLAAKKAGVVSRGTHGFRKAAAQDLYNQAVISGASERDAREKVAERLGHGRTSVTYSYVRGKPGR